MAMTPHYVHYLLTQGDLLNRILAFNADFSARQYRQRAQTHPEEIKDSLYTVHPELARFHEENNISYYFENNVDRICLIRQDELEKLLVYLGACINSRALAGIEIQEEKDLIYEQIGRDVYNFALDYGYLIKNLDFALNLNSLKQDCLYLGLCALKCIEPLFSSTELREYFIELLLSFTKSHDLNPNIITSREHVLSIIYPVNDNIKAPYPSQMNTPAQYQSLEQTNQLIAARDAMAGQQNKASTTVNGLSSLIHANEPQTQPQVVPAQDHNAPLAEQATTAPLAEQAPTTAAQSPTAPLAEQAPVTASQATIAPLAEQAPATATDATSALVEATDVITTESVQASAQDTSDNTHAKAETNPSPESQAVSGSDASSAPNDAEQAQANASTESANPVPTAAPANADNNGSQDQHVEATTAAQDAMNHQPAPIRTSKEVVKRPDGSVDYSIVPEGVGVPLEVNYTDAALYGSHIDKRKFRAASLKQRQEQKNILSGVQQEPKEVEEQQLITLEFSARQVFEISAVVLKFQIDEHWHEYLQE